MEMDLRKTMESIVIRQDRFAERMDQLAKYRLKLDDQRSAQMERYSIQHAAEMAGIRAELRRGIRLSIEEIRRDRERRKSLHDNVERIGSSLQELIEALKNK
jgi:hypothetical protein